MKLIDWLLDLLFPPKCVFCRKLLDSRETDLCARCRQSLPKTEGEIKAIRFCEEAFSLYYYENKVPESVRRYKFSGMQNYGAVYGKLLALEILRRKIPFDLVTFVPVSAKRRKKRGFDQSELMAQTIGRELDVPVYRCLTKDKDNPPQSGLKSSDLRAVNVLGVYKPYHPDRFREKKILLIDDVLTTGATVSECCATLRIAGASEVRCLTVAAARKICK